MAGISLLRPQYNSLGSVATRLAGGARQVAHESTNSDVAGLLEARAGGGQEDTVPQEVVAQPFDKPRDRDGERKEPRGQARAPSIAATSEPAAEFRPDSHQPADRIIPVGLVVAAPLGMSERLRAAKQAYGYSSDVLRGVAKTGGQLDAAS